MWAIGCGLQNRRPVRVWVWDVIGQVGADICRVLCCGCFVDGLHVCRDQPVRAQYPCGKVLVQLQPTTADVAEGAHGAADADDSWQHKKRRSDRLNTSRLTCVRNYSKQGRRAR